jgi:hypothetical protein
MPTNAGAYDIIDYFKMEKQSGSGKAFGSINRFGYYHSPNDKFGMKPLPSPAKYRVPG